MTPSGPTRGGVSWLSYREVVYRWTMTTGYAYRHPLPNRLVCNFQRHYCRATAASSQPASSTASQGADHIAAPHCLISPRSTRGSQQSRCPKRTPEAIRPVFARETDFNMAPRTSENNCFENMHIQTLSKQKMKARQTAKKINVPGTRSSNT